MAHILSYYVFRRKFISLQQLLHYVLSVAFLYRWYNYNCNCRNKNSCPLEGNCNIRNIVYQAEVVTPQTKETYIGLCDTTFKERYRNHTCSFRNQRYKNATELSKYIWGLKEQKINYQIMWRKVKQARSYSNVNKKCNLCLWEKYFIICKPEMSTLNHRDEMTSTCRHSKKFLLNTVFT